MHDGAPLDRVRDLAAEFDGRLHGPTKDEFDRIARRLGEPLRVAVAGRVKSGKSTLVNALLRQAVAPTDVSECTKVVTWYRRGHPERVEARLRDGSTLELQLDPDGTVPRSLPVETPNVAALHVFLDNDALRLMTVIDTPGLGSVNEELSASTEELLSLRRRSVAAAEAADAVAFVLNQTVREDDLGVLEEWARAGADDEGAPQGDGGADAAAAQPAARNGASVATDGHRGLMSSAVNAIGVLTKADKLGDGHDPWPVALELASRHAQRIRKQVATVVPVMGLIAETANTARLTEHDVGRLAALARLDGGVREPMLWSAERFMRAGVEIDERARHHLLGSLDMFGLRFAIDLVARGFSTAAALNGELARSSGIERLQAALAENFLSQRSDVLLARSTLDALHALTFRDGEQRALRDLRSAIEALRLDPSMHELAEIDALHATLTREVELPAALGEDVARIASSRTLDQRLGLTDGTPESARTAAQQGLARWRAFAASEADPRQSAVARVMIRSYTLALKSTQPR